MKKLNQIILLAVALISLSEISAQDVVIKGGLNVSNLHENRTNSNDSVLYTESKMKTGINLGFGVLFPLSESWTFETGLIYSQKGCKEQLEETITEYDPFSGFAYETSLNYKSTIKINYIDVPILVRHSWAMQNADLYVYGGAMLSFAVSGNVSYKITIKDNFSGMDDTYSDTEELTIGNEDDVHPLDYGAIFGIGMNIDKFNVSAGYSFGFNNVLPSAEGSEYFNRNLQISIGLIIPDTKK